ncbi:MAG: DUF6658 family protein [Nostocales cyanobacterium 94392]|nr:DUF6658 family protein [Nostocales cyanobacterium 94392]
MNRLTGFLKKLQLRQILTIFLVGIFLCTTSIVFSNGQYALEVNSSNAGLQTDKLAQLDIELGTPIAAGGDSQLLIAANKSDGLLYPGAETPQGRIAKEKELPIKNLENINDPQPGGLIQRSSDFGNRVEGRLDAVKETFEEASDFLNSKAQEAKARPEIQKNPVLGK